MVFISIHPEFSSIYPLLHFIIWQVVVFPPSAGTDLEIWIARCSPLTFYCCGRHHHIELSEIRDKLAFFFPFALNFYSLLLF
jgi:hypothetical protein